MAELNVIVKLAEEIEAIEKEFPRIAGDIVGDVAGKWAAALKVYPPQPDRMRSGRLNTYVRGVGFYPVSHFKGGMLQFGRRVGAGQIQRVSEKLGSKWRIEVKPLAAGARGIAFNTASYAPKVQGSFQPKYHKRTGWRTIHDEAADSGDLLAGALNEAAEKVMELIGE